VSWQNLLSEGVTMVDVTTKPTKPYPDFPLFPHDSGRWAKKIRGKHHYFGKWAEPDAALAKYLDQRDDLHAGRVPRATRMESSATLEYVLNHLLDTKQKDVGAGLLAPSTYVDYQRVGARLLKHFGTSRLISDITALDLRGYQDAIGKTWAITTLSTEIGKVLHVFRYAFDHELLATPLRTGKVFVQPSKAQMRKHRALQPKKLFTNDQIRMMIDKANVHMRAMIYLGLNCGYGNHDIAKLQFRMIDFEGGWIDYPRPKTGIERRCPLWPETSAALRESIGKRTKKAKSHDFVFVTQRGDPISTTMRADFMQLVKKLKIHEYGKGFYCFRHVFATLASNSKDQVAVNHIMGHVDASMASVYRESIDDKRLIDVVNVVRLLLFGNSIMV
jgi:integrase